MHLVFERFVKDLSIQLEYTSIYFIHQHPDEGKKAVYVCKESIRMKFDYHDQGTKEVWVRCNESVAMDIDVVSSAEYHLLLAKKGYHGLIYKLVISILGCSSIA